MEEYLKKLQNKFNYSEKLMNCLSNLIPAMITYFGKEYENKILEALFNCEIHFQIKEEDPNEYLNSYFDVNKNWDLPFLGGAFYHNEICVKDNQIVATPIIYLKRVYFNHYKPFDFQDDNNVDTLVHEICHLVKGYGKTKVENGKIIDSTGLTKDICSYDKDKGGVIESENRVGIEEAINVVDTMHIMEIMTGRKQEPRGYKRAGKLAMMLLEHEDIAKVIKASQFNGSDDWISYLGEDVAQMLIENFDILVNAMYISFSDINTPEKKQALQDKMDKATETIYNFIKNYCSQKTIDEFQKNLKLADAQIKKIIEQNGLQFEYAGATRK